ncbi:MAG: lysophospholipid acyltransferase family protein [Ferruginibacter sp.]|jgi:1-acyl-sn-glycerol-3-phosphate acyltransferase
MKKIATDIFARIWALWGLISFVATFLLIFIPSMISYLFPEPASQRYFLFVSRIWMNIWLTLVGCPLRIRGKQHFKKGEVYVVVYNHNTLLDVPLSCPYVPGPNKTIAKSSFARIPLFGWFYAKGSVLVDRKDERSRTRSFDSMKQVLNNGMHMCIYPEGTRNRTDQPLKSFYDGAFRLAKNTGHSIIPGIISGTKEAMPVKRSFYFLPKKLSMEYLEPISTEGRTVEECKQLVYDSMLARIRKNNGEA